MKKTLLLGLVLGATVLCSCNTKKCCNSCEEVNDSVIVETIDSVVVDSVATPVDSLVVAE